MSEKYRYFSLQYSAIQKAILRQDRLWSIAGISQGLAKINEIDFVKIVEKDFGGKVLVAGGGKFTARFEHPEKAQDAKDSIVEKISIMFPMLELQISGIVPANSFIEAKQKGLLAQLDQQKRTFRGYSTSYLPHLATCEECGEYPAEREFAISRNKVEKTICRSCYESWNQARIDLGAMKQPKDDESFTTLERIYAGYLRNIDGGFNCEIAHDFEDLFTEKEKRDGSSRQRMAVWSSDLNNMNQKVQIWLQQEEDDIFNTFKTVKDVNISVVVNALTETFSDHQRRFLPFRLIVAGGDDLCIVMPEQYVLAFATNLSSAINEKIRDLDSQENNPLNTSRLQSRMEKMGRGNGDGIKPYSFGASFIVTTIHTPFKKIHEIGEGLMGIAKQETERMGNGVNWRIMAEAESVSDKLLEFERPLFVECPPQEHRLSKERLTFNDYLELRDEFLAISSSQKASIVELLFRYKNDPRTFTTELKKLDGATRSKSFSGLFASPRLKRGDYMDPVRIATLFEFLSIKKQ